jgi:acyl carrier protein
MTAIESTLKMLLREVMPRSLHKLPLKESMSLQGEMAIDSIGLMSLVFRIEEELQIDLMQDTDRVAAVRTLGDLLEIIHDLNGAPR